MSEIDQAFIKAYQESRATPPAKRPAAPPSTSSASFGPTAAAAQRYENKTWRVDGAHASAHNEPPQPAAQAPHPRVPTPHLHFAARGAAWLERSQPQLVAAAAPSFVAEEYEDEEVVSSSAIDPWIVPSQSPLVINNALRSGGNGPRGGEPLAKPDRATPDAYAAYSSSSSIRPSGPRTPPPPSLPVRPLSSATWSPAPPMSAAPVKPVAERIPAVQKHTDEMSQHLTSVAHTLAMLEGGEATDICVEQREITLVIGEGAKELNAGILESALASLAPPEKRPELRLVMPSDPEPAAETQPEIARAL